MPGSKKKKRPGQSQAAFAFESFLDDNEISRQKAALDLGVRHPSVIAWITGRAKPDSAHRKLIELWTGGVVTEDSWLTKDERKALGAISPYAAKAKSGEHAVAEPAQSEEQSSADEGHA